MQEVGIFGLDRSIKVRCCILRPEERFGLSLVERL